METREIKINIQTARVWYNGEDKYLRELALQAFSVNELTKIFPSIKTFKDACEAVKLDYDSLKIYMETLSRGYSKASVAMFKLNIIRKALNLGQDLHLTKDTNDSYIYCPYNPFITISTTSYRNVIDSGDMEIIGRIKSEEDYYYVLGGSTNHGGYAGLGGFSSCDNIGYANSNYGFLGCASEEIAQHFGKYFGMLITEAKYGDIIDFEIIDSKYPN